MSSQYSEPSDQSSGTLPAEDESDPSDDTMRENTPSSSDPRIDSSEMGSSPRSDYQPARVPTYTREDRVTTRGYWQPTVDTLNDRSDLTLLNPSDRDPPDVNPPDANKNEI